MLEKITIALIILAGSIFLAASFVNEQAMIVLIVVGVIVSTAATLCFTALRST